MNSLILYNKITSTINSPNATATRNSTQSSFPRNCRARPPPCQRYGNSYCTSCSFNDNATHPTSMTNGIICRFGPCCSLIFSGIQSSSYKRVSSFARTYVSPYQLVWQGGSCSTIPAGTCITQCWIQAIHHSRILFNPPLFARIHSLKQNR